MWRWLGPLCIAGLSLPAFGQKIELAPSAALACLTPAASVRGTPEYPFAAFKTGQKGRVHVSLSFTIPDGAPTVKVLAREGDAEFVDAVRAHVRDFRVPCHSGETPTELQFEFFFQPDERRVFGMEPVDAAEAERKRMALCIVHQSGKPALEYPRAALRAAVQGRVVAEMRFVAADQPPVLQTFSRPKAEPLKRAVDEWLAGMRMPCHVGGPVDVWSIYIFRFEGEAYGFKPGTSLRAMLPAVAGIHTRPLKFDLNQMSCPFDVSLIYRQPHLPNIVGVRGEPVAARRPFLEWLASVQLDLKRETLDSIYGDTLELHVPCLNIDLNPQSPQKE